MKLRLGDVRHESHGGDENEEYLIHNDLTRRSHRRTEAIFVTKNLATALHEKVSFHNCGDGVEKKLAELTQQNYIGRIWEKDGTLWKKDSASLATIKNSLGWLNVSGEMQKVLPEINEFVKNVRQAGFTHVVHLGMGGSSLTALVFARTFGFTAGLPLTVLDTTEPVTIQKVADSVSLEKTLFVVASKSGTTVETLALKDYFYDRLKTLKGDRAGENFIAITDADNSLAETARKENFRHLFINQTDIGGRYSALTYFGLVPAALMGIDIAEILVRAQTATDDSQNDRSVALTLGALIGDRAEQRKNKVTFLLESSIQPLGLWLEQLIAESTGKEGRGIVPIADEPQTSPDRYSSDRLFVYMKVDGKIKSSVDEKLEIFVADLCKASQPVVTISLKDLWDVGQEFFRWEFITAIASSIIGVNAFDQPNVQENKNITEQILSNFNRANLEKPTSTQGPLGFFAGETLNPFLSKAQPGDYLALMAFLPETPATDSLLQSVREILQKKLNIATTSGYGPRFLHSTGQLHKGGPPSALFIQLTADYLPDLSIPKRKYSFGQLIQAQAQGDLQVLRANNRHVIRIHLGRDIEAGLAELLKLI